MTAGYVVSRGGLGTTSTAGVTGHGALEARPGYTWNMNTQSWDKDDTGGGGGGGGTPSPSPTAPAAPAPATGTAPAPMASPAMAGITNVVNQAAQDPAKGWMADQGIGGGQQGLGTRTPSMAMDMLRQIVAARGKLY